jgi:hypothetical protein
VRAEGLGGGDDPIEAGLGGSPVEAGLGGSPVEAELGGGGLVEAGLGSGARDWIEDDGRPRKKTAASSEQRQMHATEQDADDWIPMAEATAGEKKPTRLKQRKKPTGGGWKVQEISWE